jgi:hypothetical protein
MNDLQARRLPNMEVATIEWVSVELTARSSGAERSAERIAQLREVESGSESKIGVLINRFPATSKGCG